MHIYGRYIWLFTMCIIILSLSCYFDLFLSYCVYFIVLSRSAWNTWISLAARTATACLSCIWISKELEPQRDEVPADCPSPSFVPQRLLSAFVTSYPVCLRDIISCLPTGSTRSWWTSSTNSWSSSPIGWTWPRTESSEWGPNLWGRTWRTSSTRWRNTR